MIPIHGQPRATALVKAYLRHPESRAFLLHGPTGTGKTTTAHNLADGLAVDRSPIGGFDEIASGEQTAEAVRAFAGTLRLRPMVGDWRILIVNECDQMTKTAEVVWLDVLEHLPPRVLIVFTTNSIDKLSQRFVDRCKSIEYVSNARAVRAFAESEWERRMSGMSFPDTLHSAGCRPSKSPSYRLAMSDIEDAIAILEEAGDDAELTATLDPRYWIVHQSNAVWGCFSAAQCEDAAGMYITMMREMPHGGFLLSRCANKVGKNMAVPADAVLVS